MSRTPSIDIPAQSIFQSRPSNDAVDRSKGNRDGLDHSAPSRDADGVRSVFSRGLDLPRTSTRERVFLKDRCYELRASEVRVLSTIGAFRVVDARDLEGGRDARRGELARLRHLNLIEV